MYYKVKEEMANKPRFSNNQIITDKDVDLIKSELKDYHYEFDESSKEICLNFYKTDRFHRKILIYSIKLKK